MMKRVVVFDFDGTLTSRDSFLAFIRYAKGRWAFFIGMLIFVPLLVLMLLRLYPNYKAKQKVFAHFFGGTTIEMFNGLCQSFANNHLNLLRQKGKTALEQERKAGAEVVIVSASIDNWVQRFFPDVTVLGTKVEVKDGILTGRFLTKNCYGQEKVNRLLEKYPAREDYHLTAYGDSRGDKELLAFADEACYKPFR